MRVNLKALGAVSVVASVIAGCGTSASGDRTTAKAATATVSTTAPPRPTTTTTIEPGACNCGLLQMFSPESSTTWWAIIESNLTSATYLVRTTDSGRTWQNVLTENGGMNGYFFNTEVAWIETGGQLYRSLEGGTAWQRLDPIPSSYCQYDFVNDLQGWCSALADHGHGWRKAVPHF